MARVSNSVGSRRNLRNSTSASANVSRTKSLTGLALSQAAGCPAIPGALLIASDIFYRASYKMDKYVIQIGCWANLGLQCVREARSPGMTAMHDHQRFTKMICLFHIVRGQKNRGSITVLQLPQMLPHSVSCDWFEPYGTH